MIILSGITLAKLVIVMGLAIWSLLESLGLIKDFSGAKRIVGRIMNMEPIEEPPLVPTKLLNRRIANSFWHQSSTIILILLNLSSSLLLFISIYYFFDAAMLGKIDQTGFLLWANYGIAMFISMGFLLSFMGLWFAYYIKQIDLMIVHFVLIILGIISAVVINFPTS
ncbi:DUF2165 family protein [Facilibium subflavum]|uniref:DUF2165 family protein n=1 Tax=Facilibium subflavum TaxID=2219058 RepID=UPI000E65E1E8|nr:DUF2165 family protein [Facilibium subflavum]